MRRISPFLVSVAVALVVLQTVSWPGEATRHAADPNPQEPQLQWQASLENDPDWKEFRGPGGLLAYTRPRIAILGNSRVAVSFQYGESMPVREEPDSTGEADVRVGSRQFKAMFWEASTGAKEWEQSWPTFPPIGKVIPTLGGGFVVHAGNELRSYSQAHELRAQRQLPSTRVHARGGDVRYTDLYGIPGGRKVFLKQCREERETRRHLCSYSWVSVEDLQDTAEFPDTSPAPLRPSEKAVARNMPIRGTWDDEVHIWQPGSGWGILPVPRNDGAFLFIADEKLLLYGGDELKVANLQGEVYLKARVTDIALDPKASLRGNRVAVFDEQRPSVIVRVFDVEEKREIARMTIRNPRGYRDLALSESGESLAILHGSIVQVYALPPIPR